MELERRAVLQDEVSFSYFWRHELDWTGSGQGLDADILITVTIKSFWLDEQFSTTKADSVPQSYSFILLLVR
jgi:hypothetical protein